MPQNITDVVTYTSPIVAPADGDLETAASVVTGFQGLSNRSAFFNAILSSTGVTLLRTGNSAAMTALVMTAGQSGQIFYRSKFGIYEYINPSSLTVDSQWVFTAAGAASGQWVHELYFNIDSAGLGIAGIGAINGNGVPAGRIQQTVIPYGIVGTPLFTPGTIAMTTSSTTVVQLTGSSTISLGTLNVGDIVEFVCPSMYLCLAASGFTLNVQVSENGGAYFPVTSGLTIPPNSTSGYLPIALSFIRTVAAAGAYSVQFFGSTSNGGFGLTCVAQSIYARVTRA